MKSYLTRLEAYVARWLFRRVVEQGYHHFDRTSEVLSILGEEWSRMFTEDNTVTQVFDLQECFNRAMGKPSEPVSVPAADPLDHNTWPEIPKDPCGRTFDGKLYHGIECKCPTSQPPDRPLPARTRPRPARNMTEMYERARWKCERCGKMNEWGQPTCPCNHKR